METPKNKKKLVVKDAVLIGDWEEVNGIPLSKVTKNDKDTATLDGLIIKGYETKFNVTNENGERYAPNCLDKFVQQYFVDHELNMVVDLQLLLKRFVSWQISLLMQQEKFSTS